MKIRCRSRVLRHFLRARSAGPIVEFALVVPILMTIVMAIVDFGRAYFVRNSLVSAVREGARLAAVQSVDPCTVRVLIRQRVVDSFASVGSVPIPNTEASIPITCETVGGRTVSILVRVVDYPFQPIFPLFGDLGIGSSLNASARFRWELSS